MTAKNNTKEQPDDIALLSIIDRYLVDLECLREMFIVVMPALRKQDEKREAAVKDILIRAEKSIETSMADASLEQPADALDAEDQDSKKKTVCLHVRGVDTDEFISNIRKMKRAEALFAKQSIVSFVSRFDEFLGHLLEIALAQNPDWLSPEKTITYKELMELQSIDTAIKGVIAKEIEQLLRGSHEEQISYIDQKLKLGIKQNFAKLPFFLEVAERRNLFVHTGGKVSKQYMEKCKCFGYKLDDIKERSTLTVTAPYFETAFAAFFEIGLRIGQATFRRLFPESAENADRALNKLAIKFLNYGDYELAEVITNYDLNIPDKLRSTESEYRYYATINRAFARKFQGLDFEAGLEGIHWKVFHPKYTLCLHVLRDEFNEAAALMGSNAILQAIGEDSFRTWPIFRDFRSSKQFQDAYKCAFSHEYGPDLERDAPAITRQEEFIEEQDLPSHCDTYVNESSPASCEGNKMSAITEPQDSPERPATLLTERAAPA